MAKMIDPKPCYNGEAKLWESLRAYLPESTIVYNNREINGREFDYCVFIENAGALIIEVKGWKPDEVTVRGVDDILIAGYSKPQRSPKKQARAYRFALLNRINARYNTSPLIFDMVCYPFISKEEYLNTRLDIVSEEQFTIFKDDLESREGLVKKIQMAYDASKLIPHSDFTYELMFRLRQEWEPGLIERSPRAETEPKPYSILSVLPGGVDTGAMVNEYFAGIKRVLFVGSRDDYAALVRAFDEGFEKHNVQPDGNQLSTPYSAGLRAGEASTRAFNLEIYLVNDMAEICPEAFSIEEGRLSDDELGILAKLAGATKFNLQQFRVEHASTRNNTLVEAGAGTGKTFSMVSRVAFLCNRKIGAVANIADELAMVTFTNAAAANMKTRLKQMFMNYFILTSDPRYLKFVEDADHAHISTIHSFALDILRGASLYTGLGTNFKIAADEHARGLIYDLHMSEFLEKREEGNPDFIKQLPVPVYELKKKAMGIADRLIAKSVDLGQITPAQMGANVPGLDPVPYFNELIEHVIIPSEAEYFQSRHADNGMDLKECIILLRKLLDKLDGKLDDLRIRYLFVDEFQDTDDVQIKVFQMLQKAVNAECRLFVVGDLKQSIYRFRGAKMSAFEQMKKACTGDWGTYHLTINYRTDKRLLELYDAVFQRMGDEKHLPYNSEQDRLYSSLVTDVADGDLLVSVPCHTKDEQAFFDSVIDSVKRQEARLSDLPAAERASDSKRTVAVLTRNNRQVEKLVREAKKRGVRLETKSGGDLFQIEPTLDLYKLALALNNNSSPVHLINLIESNYTNLALDYAQYHGMSENDITRDLTRVLDEFFRRRMGASWRKTVDEAYTQPALFVLKRIFDALEPWRQYGHTPRDQKYYMANFEYLLECIIRNARADTLTLRQVAEYLRVNIVTGQQQPSREPEAAPDGVRLLCTTIHKSKGLEYGAVILPYTNEDISDIRKVKLDANYSESRLAYTVAFDNKLRQSNSYYSEEAEIDEQISEESRILYVALTRAMRNCVWFADMDSEPAVSWGTQLEGEYADRD